VRAYLPFEFWEYKVPVRVFSVLTQRAFTAFLYFVKNVHDIDFFNLEEKGKNTSFW